jgi:hypothetical protein
LLIDALLAAIMPTSTLSQITAATSRLARHLREPPRKREYQKTSLLSG